MNKLLKTKRILTTSAALGLLSISTGLSANDSIAVDGRRALDQIVSQVTAQPTPSARVADLKRALAGAKVIAVPRNRGVAASQSVPHAPAATGSASQASVTANSAPEKSATDWRLPEFEIEPLIDPTVFFFSFGQ